jgi:1-acyl-sn-glycerol-3-phosphate acyltransferase
MAGTAAYESRGDVIARRFRTVPPVVLGCLLVTLLFPVLLILASLVDAGRFVGSRRPFMATRLLAFLWVYLAAESIGLLTLLAIWVAAGFGRRRQSLAAWTWRCQQAWAGTMFAAASRLMGLRVQVSGEEALRPGPVIVLVRHASIVDNLLPSVLVARAHGIRLRYVLKRELLRDPCLDVAGNRLPNYFVRRGTGERAERENLRRLAEDLSARDGVLLYPEGTRFTAERRARAVAQIAERDPQRTRRVEGLTNLLPPKAGGFLALLQGAPGVDVVVMAHAGLDGLRLISDIWGGALIGRTIRVRFRRTARGEIPEDPSGRVGWLDDAWAEADAWVGAQLGSPPRGREQSSPGDGAVGGRG